VLANAANRDKNGSGGGGGGGLTPLAQTIASHVLP